MTSANAGADTALRFRAALGARLGLQFEDGKLAFLKDVLRRHSEITHGAPETYVRQLESTELPKDEFRSLVQELTVPETYFFRNIEQFRAFSDIVLPGHLRAQPAKRTLRVLSAGCASGEEAYSLAIMIREHLGDDAASWRVEVLAFDINGAVLEKARRGRYSAWSLRETPAPLRERWFRAEGQEFVLDESIRTMVTFEERNLASPGAEFWKPESFDAVFCRNITMYFLPQASRAAISRIASALAPGGYLFLGHAETLRGISHDFHLCHTHETFYYQRRDTLYPARAENATDTQFFPVSLAANPLAAAVESAGSWVDTIQRASERIEALTRKPSMNVREPTLAPLAKELRATWDTGSAVELLRKERFAEALALVRDFPPESALDPDVLLLRAVLLTQAGNLLEAQRVCTDLLVLDDLNAGAHYLMALCHEGAGDRREAAEHDQVAVYVDPGFAMPRLHLGLMARRAGDLTAARRELGQALALLEREDASRLILFGGGFNRDALVALCRAELAHCGGVQ